MTARKHLIWALAGIVLGLAAGLALQHRTPSTGPAGPISLEEAPERFEQILEQADPQRRAGAVAKLFQSLEPPTPDSTGAGGIDPIREVFERSKIQNGDIEFALFAEWWARSAPAQAYHWTQVAPQGGSTSVLVAVFQEWGPQDPLVASRAASSLRFAGQRRAALAGTLRAADRADQLEEVLLGVLREIPERSDRRAALQVMLDRRLASQGPAQILAWPARFPEASPEMEQDLIAAAAVTASRADPARAADAISALSRRPETSELPAGLIEDIAARWVETDPTAALAWLGALGPSSERDAALQSSFQRWLGREREAAMAWAADRTQKEPGNRLDPVKALYGLILGHRDPEAGLRVLFELPIGGARAQNVQAVFANWKAIAPDEAEDWLDRADLPDFRKEDLRQVPLPARPLHARARARETMGESR